MTVAHATRTLAADIPYFEDRLRVSTLADIVRFEQVPLEARGLPDSAYAMLRNAADYFPSHVALHFFEDGDHPEQAVSITHRDFFASVTRAANVFHDLGVRTGDVIGILGTASPEMQYAMWGGQAAGIVFPINWMLEPDILIKLLDRAGASVLAVEGPGEDSEVWNKLALILPHLPQVRRIVKLGGDAVDEADVIDLTTAMAAQPADRLVSERRFRADDIAAMFHTGGTTGTPKLARQTQGNQVFMTWISALQYGVEADDSRVCGVPLFHVNGMMTNSLMPLARGATVVLMTRGGWRNPSVLRNLWRIVEHFGVTMLPMVPSVVNSLLKIPVGTSDISSLRVATSGTAPLSPSVAGQFEKLTGLKIVEGYGLTETTAVSAANPRYGEVRIGSIGFRKAYQAMKAVKIGADGAMLADCGPGETGVIVISGPNVIPGYLDPAQNKALFAAEGWLNTGDIGYQDEDGYFWITGRAKDLIIRGGHNIDPQLIEEAFYRHPAVSEAAAVGLPDLHVGELPVVYLKLHGDQVPRPGRLKFYAYESIPERAAVPKAIYEVAALPRTAVGKIQKNLLRRDAVLRSAEQAIAADHSLAGARVDVVETSGGGLACRVELPDAPAADAAAEITAALAFLGLQVQIERGVGA